MRVSLIMTLNHNRPEEDALVYLLEALRVELAVKTPKATVAQWVEVCNWIDDAGRVMGINNLAKLATSTQETYKLAFEIMEEEREALAFEAFRIRLHINDKRRMRVWENDIVDGFGYSQWEMKCAFDKVANPLDWKAPIAASFVPAADVDRTVAAIVFFTATEPRVFPTWGHDNLFSIKADGYRRGPAGDH